VEKRPEKKQFLWVGHWGTKGKYGTNLRQEDIKWEKIETRGEKNERKGIPASGHLLGRVRENTERKWRRRQMSVKLSDKKKGQKKQKEQTAAQDTENKANRAG